MNHLEIYDLLLKNIASGELRPGDKITESQLSEDLGVSRTPLRQALFQLANGQFLNYQNNVGFSVPPLTKDELRECYPIIWSLEILSLKLGFGLLKGQLVTLEEVNQKFIDAKTDAKAAHKFDARFHEQICCASGNITLKKMIQDLKFRTARYDVAYFSDTKLIELSFHHHCQIIESIRENHFEKAAKALQANWECGLQYFFNFL